MVARDRRVWNGDWEMLQRTKGKLGGLMDMFYFLNYDDVIIVIYTLQLIKLHALSSAYYMSVIPE